MIALAASAGATAMQGELYGPDARFAGVSTDSRSLRPGELFVALRGPRHDAHDKLADAAAAGAAGAVVERVGPTPTCQIKVGDTRRALGLLARHWRDRFDLPIVGVTGSAGKTTVKEMIAAILARRGPVLATRGNLNNEIGVPLTLCGLAAGHRAAVIEMGAKRAGDIAWLVEVARPQVGVLTLCAPAHLEGFGDLDTIARTKGEIVSGLPADGCAVLNADDPYLPLWLGYAGRRRVITFGTAGMVRARAIESASDGTRFLLCCDGGEFPVAIAQRGVHNVMNALAAAAAARALAIAPADIAAGLGAVAAMNGRLQQRRARGGAQLLDDTYNASPAALSAALAVLAGEPGRRWLVLGDMAELGPEAPALHRAAGGEVRAAGVERLFTIGPLARLAGETFGGRHDHATDAATLLAILEAALADAGADTPTVLLKASRVMALDALADALCAAERPPC